ncbi:MAG: ATP-binding cassette domain-containing protein [Kangiellaceae bacterium]|nr:ATP-binding cassette domain-containing protein [Kangiellaceae bacterium]
MALLKVENLSKVFKTTHGLFGKRSLHHANSNINFTLEKGETLAIVGESGSGKTTLARQIIGVEMPTNGSIWLNNRLLNFTSSKDKKNRFGCIRMVFQNPYESLNPNIRIGHSLDQTLKINTKLNSWQRVQKIKETLTKVGLAEEQRHRYPHMFSGGQRQRIAIARAIILEPEIIIADEPLSALDVSVQAQILNLLQSLQEEMGISYIFISHDLRVVEHIADNVLVMYNGKVVEQGSVTQIFDQPLHPYTQALFASTPLYRNRFPQFLRQSKTNKLVPQQHACVFSARCQYSEQRCVSQSPVTSTTDDGRQIDCFKVEASSLL